MRWWFVLPITHAIRQIIDTHKRAGCAESLSTCFASNDLVTVSPTISWEPVSRIPAGEDLVPESPVQDEAGATREGAPRPPRGTRGCRSHSATITSQSGSPCAGKGRQTLHRGRQGTAAALDGPASAPPPPGDAFVLAPPHTPPPPAASPPRLVVVTISYWWWVLASNSSIKTGDWRICLSFVHELVCVLMTCDGLSLVKLLQTAKKVDDKILGNRFESLMRGNSCDQNVIEKTISFLRQLETWYFIRFMRCQRTYECP
jgi:hypothetical protein